MKRRWNRIPKMETVVCFGHVRIENAGPQCCEKKHPHRNVGPQSCEKNVFIVMQVHIERKKKERIENKPRICMKEKRKTVL